MNERPDWHIKLEHRRIELLQLRVGYMQTMVASDTGAELKWPQKMELYKVNNLLRKHKQE